MLAGDIMSQHIISVRPDTTIHDAARALSEHGISGVPVVDAKGAMVGILTEADLISKEGATAADIMSRRVTSVTEETPVDEIAQLLTSSRYKRVPVMRGEKLVGIVSRADIVRMMASRWVCQTCGSIQHGRRPDACFSCGASAASFERELDPRPEITTRQ